MNWQQIEGKWEQLKGDVRSKWGKLTDDDVHMLGGKKDNLVGKLVERYGIMKDEAEKQVDDWLYKLDAKKDMFKRSDVLPVSAALGSSLGCGTIILIVAVIIVLLIILSTCSSSSGSGGRSSGGSFGGYSSGGGHK